MNTADRNWIVEGFEIHRQAGNYIQASYPHQTPDHAGPVVTPGDEGAIGLYGCTITDQARKIRYEVTVDTSDGKTTLTSVTVLPLEHGQRIDGDLLARIPAQRLATACARYLATSERIGEHIAPMPEPSLSGEKPALEDVARAWREHGGDRHVIARLYNVTPGAVSAWLTQARKKNLIPPDSRRRGRKPSDQTPSKKNERNQR